MGYGDQQMKDLETTINNTECDSVVIGTPINLGRFIKIEKPTTRVYYELAEVGQPTVQAILNNTILK
jgi:predicted GTPase